MAKNYRYNKIKLFKMSENINTLRDGGEDRADPSAPPQRPKDDKPPNT